MEAAEQLLIGDTVAKDYCTTTTFEKHKIYFCCQGAADTRLNLDNKSGERSAFRPSRETSNSKSMWDDYIQNKLNAAIGLYRQTLAYEFRVL